MHSFFKCNLWEGGTILSLVVECQFDKRTFVMQFYIIIRYSFEKLVKSFHDLFQYNDNNSFDDSFVVHGKIIFRVEGEKGFGE